MTKFLLCFSSQLSLFLNTADAYILQRAVAGPTLNCEQGYVKRWTFPKSSPVTRRLLSLVLHTALMSVPSEPSGHKPKEKRRGVET